MSIPTPAKLPATSQSCKRFGTGFWVALCCLSLPRAAWAGDPLPAENPAAPAAVRPASGTNQPASLLLNFRNAPLGQVLEYFSEAAGFVIVTETPVTGSATITGAAPLNLDAAVDWLTAELDRHNAALIRTGRILTVVARNEARTRNIPVNTGNNPELIANNEAMATWIIPLRFVPAGDLLKVLSPFVSAQATVTANEAANALVVTDKQSNIRHLARIIQAVDNSAEGEPEIRVFHLKYANPAEVASELSVAFGNAPSSGNNPALPLSFAGGEGDFPGPPGEVSATASQPDRVKAALQVTAVADARLQAVIVGAPHDLMRQIASLMDRLDVPSTRDQKVFVYHLNHGDPNQVMAELQGLFQGGDTTATTSSSAQTSALQQRATENAPTTTSSSSTSETAGGAGGGTTGVGAGSP